MNAIKVRKFESEGLYMVRSCSSANSLYFEDSEDHKLFLSLVDKYLQPMIEIVHFAIMPTAWIIIFRTKEEIDIRKAYKEQREKSKKAIWGCSKKQIGNMVSEHFRFVISHYVRKSNLNHTRHGSKIHSKMEKFIFPNETSLQIEIEKIENLVAFNEQFLPKYFPELRFYDEVNMEGKDHELKSGVQYNRNFNAGRVQKLWLKSFKSMLHKSDVVRRLIFTTLSTHYPLGYNPFKPPQLE